MAVYTITIDSGYNGGPSVAVYYNSNTGRYYSDESCSIGIKSITPLTRECYRNDGGSRSGSLYVNPDGSFTATMIAASWTGAATITCAWTRVSYRIALDGNGGSVGVSALYKSIADGNIYADSLCCENPAVQIPVPIRAGYSFRGISGSSWSDSNVLVDPDGNITDAFRTSSITADTTRYAHWLQDYTVWLNSRGSAVGTDSIGFDRVHQAFRVSQIVVPDREGYHFLGYFTAASGGTMRIDDSGTVLDDWAPAADVTLYAQWSRYLIQLSVSRGSGSGGTSSFFYNQDESKFFAADGTTEISAIELPYYARYTCVGCYSTNARTGSLYIDATGAITDALRTAAQSFADNVTIYAQYDRLCYPISISGSGTFPGGKTLYCKVGGGIYFDERCELPASAIEMPYYELYQFTGIRASNNDTSTLYVDVDGTFTSALTSLDPTGNITVYARWTKVSLKITISTGGGTFTPRPSLYYRSSGGGVFEYWTCEGDPATSIEMPTRPGYFFNGIRASNNDTSTLYVNPDCSFTSDLVNISMTSAKTVYARWIAGKKVTLSGYGAIYYESSGARWSDADGVIIAAVVPPTRPGFGFLGYFTAATGGVKCIDADGSFVSGFAPTAATTLYAQWGEFSYALTIDKQGGEFDLDAVHYLIGVGGLFADAECTVPIDSISVPELQGYSFLGVWSAATGGTLYIDVDGSFTADFLALEPSGPTTIYSRWGGHSHTLTFNYNGGSGAVASMTVVVGSQVGNLPAATKPGSEFAGWYVMGVPLVSTTVWAFDEDAVAAATWLNDVGGVTDYFGFADAALVPIRATNGDDKKRICVSHTGKYESTGNADSGIWRNPSVTYRLIADRTFTIVFGRAYGRSGSSVSGYMITDVEVRTLVGEFPLVTISAVANEGVNAINDFSLTLTLRAVAHAQNLQGAISGGGELQSCTLRAHCDPVVIEENMMPVASDVVRGVIEVQGETIASGGQNAPTAANGFVIRGVPKGESDGELVSWSFRATKEM